LNNNVPLLFGDEKIPFEGCYVSSNFPTSVANGFL